MYDIFEPDYEPDYLTVLAEMEAKNPECNGIKGEHCYKCTNCISQKGYHGRTNLVCAKTGDVIFEE